MFVCLFPLPPCTNKTIKEWWYGTVGAWIFDLSSQTPFQLTNSLLKNFPRLMEGAHPNHHRIILLCNGGNIDYPKKVLQKLRIPMQFPTKRGRFNSFISSQWVSSTNHRPKNCAGSHRAAREGGSHSSQTRWFWFWWVNWDGTRSGEGILYIYIYVCVY